VAVTPRVGLDVNGSSRLPKLYERSVAERVQAVASVTELDAGARAHLEAGGGLPVEVADTMSENVLATFSLPFSVAPNFLIDGRDFVVPMATEEPSVVAAAANAAKLIRNTGGFFGEADPAIMTGQIQLDQVADPDGAAQAILSARAELSACGDAAIPGIARRGGGVREIEVRSLGEGFVAVHVHVDVRDAMGANAVDSVAEALAPEIARLAGGRVGLRILTNLCMKRRVRVTASVRAADVGGDAVADAIARASRFAELDPYRAATHNKGFMNGVDAAAVALGQDFRALEAGAHAFAAMGAGRGGSGYAPLSVWKRSPDGLVGSAELPLAVGTVGGSCRAHEGVRTAFAILGAVGARELAIVLASVGLASNLGALRALSSEGIQAGHMRLHARKTASNERGER
jgi:hydroxymethylglutaryl-CoA reductase